MDLILNIFTFAGGFCLISTWLAAMYASIIAAIQKGYPGGFFNIFIAVLISTLIVVLVSPFIMILGLAAGPMLFLED